MIVTISRPRVLHVFSRGSFFGVSKKQGVVTVTKRGPKKRVFLTPYFDPLPRWGACRPERGSGPKMGSGQKSGDVNFGPLRSLSDKRRTPVPPMTGSTPRTKRVRDHSYLLPAFSPGLFFCLMATGREYFFPRSSQGSLFCSQR